MRKGAFVVALAVMSIGTIFGCAYEHTEYVAPEYDVSIERIDYSIKNSDGQLLASVYYDMPVVNENSDSAERINAFFRDECDGWFEGQNRLTHFQEGWYSGFTENVSESMDAYGEDVVSEQPFSYRVDSLITFSDKNILSVLQIATYQTAGPMNQYYFGSTFDLQTGELIPFEEIVNASADFLRDAIFELSAHESLKLDDAALERINRIYGALGDDNYDYFYNGNKFQLNSEYFYDGTDYYIILNYGILDNFGSIMKWNGETGVGRRFSLIGYLPSGNGDFEVIDYLKSVSVETGD
jgi:hypothetical protein